jgi:hypothetical protein
MLYGLDIGNNSLSLGAKVLGSQIESASQMIEPVATAGGSLFGKPKLLQIVAWFVQFLDQQLRDRRSFFRPETSAIQEVEIMIDIFAGNKPMHDATRHAPNKATTNRSFGNRLHRGSPKQ